ncbi:MAG: hypothetical protein ABI767_09390 [Rhodanobacter sp.]
MRYAFFIFLSAGMIASAAIAQTLPSPTPDNSDSWAKPAAAASAITYRDQAVPAAKPPIGPFKFKQHNGNRPVDQLPPSAMDKASVMGSERPWQNGQAPVDCAMSPHAAACRH